MVYNKRNVKVWETIFVVEGMGEFPLDMLRYDNAFPLTERDSYIAGGSDRSMRRVALKSRRLNDLMPTKDRWRSFGWTVLVICEGSEYAEEIRDKVAPAPGKAGM